VMAGVFTYEVLTFELESFDVTWAESADPIGAGGQTLQPGEQASYEFTLHGMNLSKIVAAVTWTDGVGNNDAYTVTITYTDADGDTLPIQGTGDAGSTASGYAFEMPEIGQVQGINQKDARVGLAPMPFNGETIMTITARLDVAPGTTGTIPAQN
jgi:hypothetical protein